MMLVDGHTIGKVLAPIGLRSNLLNPSGSSPREAALQVPAEEGQLILFGDKIPAPSTVANGLWFMRVASVRDSALLNNLPK